MMILPAQAVHNLSVAHSAFFYSYVYQFVLKKKKGKFFLIALIEINTLSHSALYCHIFLENKYLNKSAVDV